MLKISHIYEELISKTDLQTEDVEEKPHEQTAQDKHLILLYRTHPEVNLYFRISYGSLGTISPQILNQNFLLRV